MPDDQPTEADPAADDESTGADPAADDESTGADRSPGEEPADLADTPDRSGLRDAVEAALRRVRDPEAEVTLFEAGLVEDVRLEGDRVTVVLDLSEFPPGEAESVSRTVVRAVSEVDGVDGARVEQAVTTPDLTDRDVGVGSADRVIAVASAKGGVGKTTVATLLARALAADGTRVGLFDADVHGPNVPELLGASGPVYSDEDGNPIPVEAAGLEVMSVGLLSSSAPLAWRGAMAHDALSELFEETAWDDPETLVLDLPPGTGDVVLTTLQDVPVDGVVVVTTPFHAAVSDTHRSMQLFEENDVPVLGVVSNMGEFVCEQCGHAHDLFGADDPIAALEVPVLVELPFDTDLQSAGSDGGADLPAAASDLAASLRRRLEEIWSVDLPEGAVDLRGVPAEERHDRVAEGFARTDPGETLYVVSDRDPSPVREYLLDLADEADELGTFEVRRQNPETWLLRTERPA